MKTTDMKKTTISKKNKSQKVFSPCKLKTAIEICLVLIAAMGLFYGLYRAGALETANK